MNGFCLSCVNLQLNALPDITTVVVRNVILLLKNSSAWDEID